jgi:uncharacterized damage-inducible protein DinB
MRAVMIVVIGTLLAARGAAGQTETSPANPMSQSIRNTWNTAKANIRESAEQMPESDYSFKPVDSVRTFGQIIAHVAGANYEICSAAKGEKTPFTEDHFETTAKTKAEIVKAMTDSIAYCDAAYAALTDANASEMVSTPGSTRQRPRVGPLVGNIGHVDEHYGNLVTYFRIKGMVPPSTARETKK